MFNTIVRTFLLQKLVWLRVIATRGDIAGGGGVSMSMKDMD